MLKKTIEKKTQKYSAFKSYFFGVIVGIIAGAFLAFAMIPYFDAPPYPQSRLGENNVFKSSFTNYLIINHSLIGGIYTTGFEGTGSMKPVLGKGNVGIWAYNLSADNITVGDILHYFKNTTQRNETIAHRVMKIKHDSEGKYFVMKGDANGLEDSYKVRKEQIIGVLVGVIY